MTERLATVGVIGAGGAEAAVAQAHSKSPHVGKVYVFPGNDMMRELSEKPIIPVKDIKVDDDVNIAIACKDLRIDLVDIRNERAIQAGLAGQLKLFKIPTVGPSRDSGRLEWDKEYARALGEFAKLPQPKYKSLHFDRLAWNKKYPDYYEKVLEDLQGDRYFVKAAGLFDGKGVIEAHNREEIEKAVDMLRSTNPDASKVILIEDPLIGEEASVFAMKGNNVFKILGYAQDHKRAYDGDRGPNTGGMGAVSHPKITESEHLRTRVNEILRNVFHYERGYRGILYPGLMIDNDEPSIVEFNCRWGDPEAQVIIPGLKVDFFEMGIEAARGSLAKVKISDDGMVRIDVAVATKETFDDKSRTEIRSIKEIKRIPEVNIYGARVEVEDEKYWIGGAGRIFHIQAAGNDIIEARAKLEPVYEIIRELDGENLYFRTDIGWRDVERMNQNVV